MTKRVLAIGLGGAGKTCLTILKERLEETYGKVPEHVVLLALDTDSFRDADQFAGTRLNPVFDDSGRRPEFQHVVSPGGMTMDTVFAGILSGKMADYMHWLEKDKLDRILSPVERDIRGGAQQLRPIGRTALFLRWDNPIYRSIHDAIGQMYGEPEAEEEADLIDIEKGKRIIFIIGSLSGGTGSGFFIDVANLVRRAIESNPNWQSVSVAAAIVLPDAYASYTTAMNDPTNLKPNSYAALRELDRFMRVHSTYLPYMIRYGESVRSITWSTNQPLDHVYLIDTTSRSAVQDFDLSGDPTFGVFPVIADFVLAHTDQSLGDSLAAMRSNAGQHYDKSTGRIYNSFNVMSFIFPMDDVIESFTYRFIREILARQFLPVSDPNMQEMIKQQAANEVECRFTEGSIGGRVNPAIVQKAIACTSRVEPETLDLSWQGLFSLISLSDSAHAQDYQNIEQSLARLSASLLPSRSRDYKNERFADGFTRLLSLSDQFLDEFVGPQINPDDEESRVGGKWDKILACYRDALGSRFSEALDAALLDALNRRDANKVLEPASLDYSLAISRTLKTRFVCFKEILDAHYRQHEIDIRWRQANEEVCTAIRYMKETKDKAPSHFLGKPEAQKAQESYIRVFQQKMELTLCQRVYRTVVGVLDALGASENDGEKEPSVIDTAMQALEHWQATAREMDRYLQDWASRHDTKRDEKRLVKVRRYLTNPRFEDELYQRPEHFGVVAQRVLGQVGAEEGISWERQNRMVPLDFKVVISWGSEAYTAERIAREWFVGVKRLFQGVRQNVTVAERLVDAFTGPANFANACLLVEEPLLRYNPSENDSAMFREWFVSFNVEKANNEASAFLKAAYNILRTGGISVDTTAESTTACTVVEVSRAVRLSAVEQFKQCHPAYRTKLGIRRESLHLFPEEQVASAYEQSIRALGEIDNVERALVPELVVAMGDPVKLKAFILACAYGLIDQGIDFDSESGQESTELFLILRHKEPEYRVVLTQSQFIRRMEPQFIRLSPGAQLARLHLDALHNFMLKITMMQGITPDMIEQLRNDLLRRGVPWGNILNPFSLPVSEVNAGLRQITEDLGPGSKEEPNPNEQACTNAARRLEVLESYIQRRVIAFKHDPDPRIKDLGTLMHLVLKEETGRLGEMAVRSSRVVLKEWDNVFDLLSTRRR